jgi:hypothetical protein
MDQRFNENDIVFWNVSNGSAKVIPILDAAFKTWQYYINITFVYGVGTNPFKNIDIKFAAKAHNCLEEFDGPEGTLAHATYPTPYQRLFIHFDKDEDWSYQYNFFEMLMHGSRRPWLYNVALHEIGHVLGLKHSDEVSSVMSRVYRPFINYPSFEDITHVQGYYGARNPPPSEMTNIEQSIRTNPKFYAVIATSILILSLW